MVAKTVKDLLQPVVEGSVESEYRGVERGREGAGAEEGQRGDGSGGEQGGRCALPLAKLKKATKQKAFLACYSATGDVAQAAQAAGVTQGAHREWLKQDEAYRVLYADAQSEIADQLEAEVWRRATGYLDDVVYQGAVTGQAKKYSDLLLMFALKKLRPEYRDNALAVGMKAGGDIEIRFVEPEKPSG